jgi:hypothetical protein
MRTKDDFSKDSLQELFSAIFPQTQRINGPLSLSYIKNKTRNRLWLGVFESWVSHGFLDTYSDYFTPVDLITKTEPNQKPGHQPSCYRRTFPPRYRMPHLLNPA